MTQEAALRKVNLVGLSRVELEQTLAHMGEPAFRAGQLWHWIYHRGETDFTKMTTMAKNMRARLTERFVVERPGITREQTP